MKKDEIKNIIDSVDLSKRTNENVLIRSRVAKLLLNNNFKVTEVAKILNVDHSTICFYKSRLKEFNLKDFDKETIDKLNNVIRQISEVLENDKFYLVATKIDDEYYLISDWLSYTEIQKGNAKLKLDDYFVYDTYSFDFDNKKVHITLGDKTVTIDVILIRKDLI